MAIVECSCHIAPWYLCSIHSDKHLRVELVPGEDCAWYSTGPLPSDYEKLCAYHGYGCPIVYKPALQGDRDDCQECEQHRADCTRQNGGNPAHNLNGCPSPHQDACKRAFLAQGYEADLGASAHKPCVCRCHQKYK